MAVRHINANAWVCLSESLLGNGLAATTDHRSVKNRGMNVLRKVRRVVSGLNMERTRRPSRWTAKVFAGAADRDRSILSRVSGNDQNFGKIG